MSLVTIDTAAKDPGLLGAGLGSPKSWATWLAVLRGALGLRLNRKDKRAFEAVAKRASPTQRVRELWAVVGRRSGKSRMAGLLAVFFAALVPHTLAAGETGYVMVLAASKAQAGVVFQYSLGFLQASPILRQLIDGEPTRDEIRLTNGIVIAIHTASFRTVRGRTILAAIFDEVSFWRDETSASPDIEIYRAVLPALASSGGMLVAISTPYRRIGLLHEKHRDFFGVDDADVLVVAGTSEQFNPTLDQAVIANARASDPESALAEWDGEFRSDIGAFLDDQTIDAAVDHSRPLELPPRSGIKYTAFADPSGGRHDSYTLAIGHEESGRFIADVVRGRQAPFDPQLVTKEFAALAKQYNCGEVTADSYAAAWAEIEWRDNGIKLKHSDLPKSGLYIESLPLFMRSVVSIPDHPRLLRELRLLERRTSRVGKDIIDHGRGGTDDHANALCGMLRGISKPAVVAGYGFYNPYTGILRPECFPTPTVKYADDATMRERHQVWQVEAASRNAEATAMLKARRA